MLNRINRTVALAAMTLLSASAASADEVDYSTPYAPADAIWQNTDDANKADAARVAYSRGADVRDVLASVAFQDRFAAYVEKLDAQFPSSISRVWREPAPKTQGYIEFIGEAPDVDPMPGVEVFGGGVFTQAEHGERAERAADALKANGYVNFLSYFDVVQDATHIELVIPEAAPEPDHQRIREIVRDALWVDAKSASAAQIESTRIDLQITRRDGRVYDLDWSRGGLWCRDHDRVGDPEECTSGWAVSGPNGDGIITAAHCSGLDTIGASDHNLTFRGQERDKGDVEYHTTNGVEVAEFWASSAELRDVESTKETLWMSVGDTVCVYGRSSNIRGCDHDLEAKNVTAVDDSGFTIRKLVKMSGDSSIGGDSGGGWSWSTKAWGVHSGSNDVSSFFTPVGRAKTELGIRILTK